jgi:NitT/TauT family transport system substrate-binding protein
MEDKIGQAQSAELTRSDFLKRTAAAGVGLSLLSGVQAMGGLAASTATQTVRWISPRGTLDVMDDFDLWVPIKMGYFSKLGINAKLIAGPIGDALACTKFVAQNQADMGYPSPGVLTASIDSGIPVKSIWDMISGQVFDFALPANSSITNVKQLAGKKIALGSAGWSTIVDPILVGVGLDPKTVTYVNAGNQWAQSVESGQADAGLAWEGLRAQWAGQGLKLKYLIGTTFSKQPSNVYSVRADDLNDSSKVDLYTRFLQGMIMGLEFAKANPRAAAQITYASRPALQKSLKPQAAYDSFVELATAYGTSHRAGQGWGWHYPAGWAGYLDIVHNLGQTKKLLGASDVFTNSLVTAANKKADTATAVSDAKAFKLSATFQGVDPGHPNI